jgi:hypothetical protein
VIIGSRIFGFNIDGGHSTVGLVPYADSFNHRAKKQTDYYFDDKLDGFVTKALEDIPAG